jgi:hypothetical protein
MIFFLVFHEASVTLQCFDTRVVIVFLKKITHKFITQDEISDKKQREKLNGISVVHCLITIIIAN